MPVFDEKVLRAAIVEKWGEHGAHAEVYDMLLAEFGNQVLMVCALNRRVASLEGECEIAQKTIKELRACLVESAAKIGKMADRYCDT